MTVFLVYPRALLEGFSISPLKISPCCLVFSQLVGGTSPAQSVTLSNLGTAPIQVDSVLSAVGFSTVNGCTTIAVGGTCQISVTFTPTAGGATAGSLNLNTNVPSQAVFSVAERECFGLFLGLGSIPDN